MYAITPAINGMPDVGTITVISAMSLPDNKCVVHLATETAETTWEVITEEQFNEHLEPVVPEENKVE